MIFRSKSLFLQTTLEMGTVCNLQGEFHLNGIECLFITSLIILVKFAANTDPILGILGGRLEHILDESPFITKYSFTAR